MDGSQAKSRKSGKRAIDGIHIVVARSPEYGADL